MCKQQKVLEKKEKGDFIQNNSLQTEETQPQVETKSALCWYKEPIFIEHYS